METIIQKAIKLLLDAYGAQYDLVTVKEKSGHYTANIETDTPARLIGKNGSIINALQILLKSLLFRQSGERVFVTVDVDGYREQQHERVYGRVKEMIGMMRNENLPEITLPPMKPYLRRLVHLWIVDRFHDLTSESVGEDPQRAIRIFYK